eukprot:1105400-Rhodomonas_salina.2
MHLHHVLGLHARYLSVRSIIWRLLCTTPDSNVAQTRKGRTSSSRGSRKGHWQRAEVGSCEIKARIHARQYSLYQSRGGLQLISLALARRLFSVNRQPPPLRCTCAAWPAARDPEIKTRI